MIFYDCASAPSPRRVRIFMAEKSIELPTRQVDLRGGEQFSDAYKAINPHCTVPTLVLDDGTSLTESVAICRYLEMTHPEPPLFGRDAKEMALIEMWHRSVEFDGLFAVVEAFRNHAKGFKDRALPGPEPVAQIPDLVARGRKRIDLFLKDLDRRLGEAEFVAGESYSIVDITTFVTIDFAGWLHIEIPETASHLRRWYDAVAARPGTVA